MQLQPSDYNLAMETSDELPEITLSELRRHNGERNRRKWIAWNGLVYDVTDCPRWRTDLHERMHFPGLDLTDELADAPHGEGVFLRPCVKLVGRLVSEYL